MSKKYKACIYTRLSREDGDKVESDSIANQKALIREFLKSHKEIEVVAEHSDDGYSGVNFDRPGFQKMMEEIRAGKINCVVVKDLSRFGRNYIEVGSYIEKVFPFMDVRFIAINDSYDSSNQSQSDYLVIPFKNLINDAYCRDISVKIRSQLEVKRKRGAYISAFATYGYLKDSEDHNKLVVDPFASEVVRSIFKWKQEGMSPNTIAERLNEQGALCPMEYKLSLGMKVQTHFRKGKKALWSAVSVTRILTNELYTGVLIQGRTTTPNHKVKKLIEKDESEWIRIENNHEAVIDRDTFESVQALLKKDTRISPEEETLFPLAGFVKCAGCGQNMIRKTVPSAKKKYVYYHCTTSKSGRGCSAHRIPESVLLQSVLLAVNQQVEMVSGMEDLIRAWDSRPQLQGRVKNADEQIAKLQAEIEKNRAFKLKLYESLQDSVISQDEYILFKENYEKQIREAEASIEAVKADRERAIKGFRTDTSWIETFKKYRNVSELDRKMVVDLIDTVTVYDRDHIEVSFRYAEEREAIWELAMQQEVGA